jgi:hypothetical protein
MTHESQNNWESRAKRDVATNFTDYGEKTKTSHGEVYEHEVRTFERENWHDAFYSNTGDPTLSHLNPGNEQILKFFEGSTTQLEGAMRTYACTAETEPGIFLVPWFFKLGNVNPPTGAWGRKIVVKVIEGELTVIENITSKKVEM